jgi:hypothetical protein
MLVILDVQDWRVERINDDLLRRIGTTIRSKESAINLGPELKLWNFFTTSKT